MIPARELSNNQVTKAAPVKTFWLAFILPSLIPFKIVINLITGRSKGISKIPNHLFTLVI